MEELDKIVDDIKRIRIQGATNITINGIRALSNYIQSIQIEDLNDFKNKIEKARVKLSEARPTEPGLRNGLKHVIQALNIYNIKDNIKEKEFINNLKTKLKKISEYYINFITDAKEKIGEIGARKIQNKSTIMTHCHSSVVTNIFKTAKKLGKEFEVICTETRPKYQGRITVGELLENNIPTTLIVDSAMRWVLKHNQVDLIITGCDAITSEGTVINKIGSRLLALAAKEMDVPFYAATPLIKYDPDTSLGHLSEIEQRSEEEIWADHPKTNNLTILNPAFETIARDYIDALITDVGVFPPTMISHIYDRHFTNLLNELINLK